VNSLIQMTQSIHEQDIVAKGNELRRVFLPLRSEVWCLTEEFFLAREYDHVTAE